MYFRRIEKANKEFYATNSSGNFAALARKMDDEDDSSWSVFSTETDEKPDATNLTLEQATDFILLHFSFSADQKQGKPGKPSRKKTS